MITSFSYSNNNKVYDITFPTIKAYCEGHDYQFIPYHINLERVLVSEGRSTCQDSGRPGDRWFYGARPSLWPSSSL